jgi:inner membrane protein
MDFFSHALLPYLLGGFLGLKKKYLAALVLGGIAPDLDVLVAWVNYIHPTSLLIVHRGFTHTFFFGFFVAAIMLYIASRDSIKTRAQRLVNPNFDYTNLEFSASCLAFAYAGILSHLFLDFLTSGGVPLFYPLIATRYSAEIFSQIEITIMIASLLILVQLFRERKETKSNKKLRVTFLIVLLIVSGIRIEGKEMAEGSYERNSELFPDSNLFQWAVLDNGIESFQVREFSSLFGELPHNSSFLRLNVSHSANGLERALAAADSLPQVKIFRWRAYAVAINASEKNGEWLLEYYDPVVRTESMNDWRAIGVASIGHGSIQVRVDGAEAMVV